MGGGRREGGIAKQQRRRIQGAAACAAGLPRGARGRRETNADGPDTEGAESRGGAGAAGDCWRRLRGEARPGGGSSIEGELRRGLRGGPGRLGPREIRFLRKNLGLSSTEFAIKVGVDKATVSRWERVDEPTAMGGQTERLLRVLVMSEKPVESYGLDELAVKEPKTMKMRFASGRSGWRPHAA